MFRAFAVHCMDMHSLPKHSTSRNVRVWPAVFVVYWRVSRRGYWLLIVSAVVWLATMVGMKLLLPLDYVPAKWSIPHWCDLRFFGLRSQFF